MGFSLSVCIDFVRKLHGCVSDQSSSMMLVKFSGEVKIGNMETFARKIPQCWSDFPEQSNWTRGRLRRTSHEL